MDSVNPPASSIPRPAGPGLRAHGPRWGLALAVALLTLSAAKKAQGVEPAVQAYPYQQGIQATPGMAPQPGMAMMPERMAMVDPDKKLSAGDQVTVEILEDRDNGLARMVTAAGELDVPPLGHVKVSGRTTTEAASDIKQMLEKDYYYHATVRISIDRVSAVQVRAGVVYLSGEVRVVGPQEIVAGEALTLANAILKAGGVTTWANQRKVKLMRQKNGATETTVVDYKKIIEKGDVKNDPVLQDGDRIYVPRNIINL